MRVERTNGHGRANDIGWSGDASGGDSTLMQQSTVASGAFLERNGTFIPPITVTTPVLCDDLAVTFDLWLSIAVVVVVAAAVDKLPPFQNGLLLGGKAPKMVVFKCPKPPCSEKAILDPPEPCFLMKLRNCLFEI